MSSVNEKSSDPKLWGPALWKFLHLMAASYPETPDIQYKASSRQFFYSLRHLLPCETCRSHYTQLLSIKQPQTDSARDMQEWVLWLHNEVNARVNPSAHPWTMDNVYKVYCVTNTTTSENNTQPQMNQTTRMVQSRNRQPTNLSNNLRSAVHTKTRRASRSAIQMRNNVQQRQRINSSLSPPLATSSGNSQMKTPFSIRPSVRQRGRTKLSAQNRRLTTTHDQRVVNMGTGTDAAAAADTTTNAAADTSPKKDCGCKNKK